MWGDIHSPLFFRFLLRIFPPPVFAPSPFFHSSLFRAPLTATEKKAVDVIHWDTTENKLKEMSVLRTTNLVVATLLVAAAVVLVVLVSVQRARASGTSGASDDMPAALRLALRTAPKARRAYDATAATALAAASNAATSLGLPHALASQQYPMAEQPALDVFPPTAHEFAAVVQRLQALPGVTVVRKRAKVVALVPRDGDGNRDNTNVVVVSVADPTFAAEDSSDAAVPTYVQKHELTRLEQDALTALRTMFGVTFRARRVNRKATPLQAAQVRRGAPYPLRMPASCTPPAH